MNRPKIVVWGAGPAGQQIVNEFLRQEYPVRWVTRSGRTPAVPGLDVVSADALDGAAVRRACEDAAVIVHAAGAPYQLWSTVLEPMQNNLLAAAHETGALLVCFENLYSYSIESMPISESSPERPSTKKGELRLALSRRWQSEHAAGRVKAVSVRASDYFGPTAVRSPNSVLGARFFPELLSGKTPAFLGDPELTHSVTYLPDVARAVVDLVQAPDAWGRPWIVPTLAETSLASLARDFLAKAGRSPRVGRVPSWLVHVLGWTNPLLREVVEMLDEFRHPFVVDSSAFEKRFGWKATARHDAVNETWAAVMNDRQEPVATPSARR